MKSELLKLSGKPGAPRESGRGESSPASSAGSPARRGKGGKIVGAVAGLVIIAAAAIFGIKMMSGGDSGKATMPANDSVMTRQPSIVDTQKVVEGAAPAPGGVSEPGKKEPGVVTPSNKAAEEKKPAAGGTAPADAPGARTVKAASAPGILKVTSRPRNASVYINGELQYEKTPFNFDRPPGQYTVRIVINIGGKELTFDKTVTLESGETEIISHTFEE